jgi:hypothetical protein
MAYIPSLIGDDMDAYAAEHPWRIHLAAFLFHWGCIAHALIQWGVFLLLLFYLSQRTWAVSWPWVFSLSLVIFLGALKNPFTLNAPTNSLSHRLKGGMTEVRYRHFERDLPPDKTLGPIAVRRHGF